MADLEVVTLPAPTGGYDNDTVPQALANDKCSLLSNFLCDRPGVIYQRGPLTTPIDYVSGPAGMKPVSVWTHNDNALIGMRAVSATAKRDPWVAPYRKCLAAELSAGSLTTYHVNLLTGVVTSVVVADQNLVPGPRFTRIGGQVYGIGFSSTTNVTENGGNLQYTKLLRWGGTAATPVAYASAPQAAQDVKGHYERLFVLGGRNPDGTGTIQQNTLWYSDPVANAALPDLVTAWQDNVSGLTNQIVIDADDSDDFGVALAKVGENLAIFKRRSIHVLRGYSPATFVLKPFSRSIGCIDPRSIVELDDGCYFMSDQGYMWFDGADLTPVAQHLRTDQLAAAAGAVGDNGADGGYVTAGTLPGNHVMLNIGTAASTSNISAAPAYSGYMYAPTRAWSRFSSTSLVSLKPLIAGRSSTRHFVLDEEVLYIADYVTRPDQLAAASRGFDAAGVGIASSMTFRIAGAGFPMLRNQFSRVILDYNWHVPGDVNDNDRSGWLVIVNDANGAQVGTSFNVLSQGASTAFVNRRRHVADNFAEAREVAVSVSGTSTVPLSKADIQAVHLVFQKTRQRRSD